MGKFSFAVLICMVATIVADDANAQGKRRFITIGTGGPSGVYFVVGQLVCRMVGREAGEGRKKGRKHGLRCAASSSAGSIYNIGKIRDGEFEFGLAQSDWQYHAYNGTGRFKDKRFDKLRAVFSVHSEPFQLIVGKDSGINSWADLSNASLADARLFGADLRNADFIGAELRGADLRNAKGLTREQLDSACGDADTKLPEYLGNYEMNRCQEEGR